MGILTTNDLRDKLDGNELDLSMMSLTEIPVKEIAALPRFQRIDLSSNQLTSIPLNFATTLQHITHLEIGSNKLTELPANISCLVNLKHLDLYNNQLTEFPTSMCFLKSLKWLDVKDNPLNKQLQKIAGDCLNPKECEDAAKNIVAHLKQVHSMQERQKQKKLQEERDKEAAIRMAEENEKAKKRAERKAAKDKRKQEAADSKKATANGHINGNNHIDTQTSRDVKPQVHKRNTETSNGGFSLCGWLNILLLFLLFGATAACIYIYADGDLSIKGIQTAYPKLMKNGKVLLKITKNAFEIDNMKKTFVAIGDGVGNLANSALLAIEPMTGDLSPYINSAGNFAADTYNHTKILVSNGYSWASENIDWDYIVSSLQMYWNFMNEKFSILMKELNKNELFLSFSKSLSELVSQLSVHFQTLLKVIVENFYSIIEFIQKEGPIYIQLAQEKVSEIYDVAKKSVENMLK